jgi:repressor LexA
MKLRPLTERQTEVLDYIKKYIAEHRYPPTIREIAEHFRMSVKGAHDHVLALKRKRKVISCTGKSRTIIAVLEEKFNAT